MDSSAIRSSPRAEAPLGQAAARLLQDPPAELAQLAPDFLAAQVEWVLARADGGGGADDRVSPATLVIRRLLVDELRGQLLSTCDDATDGNSAVVAALRRLEVARAACRPTDEQAFAAELADQGGLNLVVEVAHDMRSPLTSILFLSEVLHKGQSGPLNDAQKHQIGIIYSAALGLENIASDMIDTARGERRLSPGNAAPFSVNEITNAVATVVRPIAEQKRLNLVVHPLREPLRVGHPIALSRVILNLCTNALKFTQEGTVEITPRSLGGHAVEFSVKDTGCGIGADAMSTLFQPFRREPARASGYVFSGTGLGLAICRRLVAAMGSDLKVESGPAGTRFWFEIPLPPARIL